MEDGKKKTKEQQEAEAASQKRKGLVLARRQRRKDLRALAKRNGHKLGHNNRKCKVCGVARSEGNGAAVFGVTCEKKET